MTDEEIKFLEDNAVITEKGEVLSVSLCVPLYAGRFKDTKRSYETRMVSEWVVNKGHKIVSGSRGPSFRNFEEANRDVTWNFSLAKKTNPAKVAPVKSIKTKKVHKTKQTTNEG